MALRDEEYNAGTANKELGIFTSYEHCASDSFASTSRQYAFYPHLVLIRPHVPS